MTFAKHLLRITIVFALILSVSSCDSAADSPYPEITFEQIAPMPGTGRSSAVAFVLNNKAYVTLGRNSLAADSLKECWEYDPTQNSWAQRMTFPGQARVKAVAAVVNGKAYIGLGFRRNLGAYTGGNLKDFWCYDPISNNWERQADLPSLCSNACFCFVINEEIYVGAGFNGSSFQREFWKFNPTKNSWTKLNNLLGVDRGGAVGCADAKHIFFGSGFHTHNQNDWWEYNLSSDSWKKRQNMPDDGRVNGVSFAINNRYFVATGRRFGGDMTGGHVKSDIIEYDANKDEWYRRGNLTVERENAICFIINGKAYIGLGENDQTILNDIWSFEP